MWRSRASARSRASGPTKSKGSASTCSSGSRAITPPSWAFRFCRCSRPCGICSVSTSEDESMTAAPKAFVVGHPIGHSRSPLIHGFWLRERGLEGSYERIDVAPADFAAFLRSFPDQGFRGGNVTIPHKEAAFRLADAPTARARRLQAANTLWIEDGRIHADNTDELGFMDSLDQALGSGWSRT